MSQRMQLSVTNWKFQAENKRLKTKFEEIFDFLNWCSYLEEEQLHFEYEIKITQSTSIIPFRLQNKSSKKSI